MKKKCQNCKLVNYPNTEECSRCGMHFVESESITAGHKLLKRAIVCGLVTAFALGGFYASLVFSAKPLSFDERKSIARR